MTNAPTDEQLDEWQAYLEKRLADPGHVGPMFTTEMCAIGLSCIAQVRRLREIEKLYDILKEANQKTVGALTKETIERVIALKPEPTPTPDFIDQSYANGHFQGEKSALYDWERAIREEFKVDD